jgi:hypothetical protein
LTARNIGAILPPAPWAGRRARVDDVKDGRKNMKKIVVTFSIYLLLAGVGGTCRSRAAELGETTQIIDLLKSNYVDHDKLDQKLLNDATVGGILHALGRGAQIMTADEAKSNAVRAVEIIAGTNEPLARAEIIDPNIGYIRLAEVTENTVSALDGELRAFADAKVEGYVLDLRYADGTNYAAAAEVASRFVAPNQELFTLKTSQGAPQIFQAVTTPHVVAPELSEAPLMVLVNGRTRGSAEALAGVLHAQDRGILVGATTAGSAVAWDDITLDSNRVLRVATAKIELPGDREIFPAGVTPDIPVKIDAKIEREAVLHSATNLTLTATLRPHETRIMSEAELVKSFRGEAESTNSAAPGAEEGDIQKVSDVVLQRAVDILKGIRVLLTSQ